MNLKEVYVLFVLAVCCFIANVLHGLTGCGSILVLHALWQTAVTFTPDVLHSTKAFGDENVKSIAEFSYVLTFFIQVVLTALLFLDERRKRAQQLEQGVPSTPSQLNGVLLLAFIPCSFIGAAVGIYTMPAIHENGSRIILGGSSLFFALTFLSLYQMKYLEKKETEDVIRDDLMLMRIQSEVQRHVIVQYMEDEKRRKARKERRRRHRALRLQAKKAEKMRRRELRMRTLAANTTNNATAGAPGAANGTVSSSLVVVPAGEGREDGAVPIPQLEGAPLEPNEAPASPARGSPHGGSLADSLTNRPLEVHGPSHLASPHAHMISEVRLPESVTGDDGGFQPNQPVSPVQHRHRLRRLWIKELDLFTYIRQRLLEISSNVDSPDEEVAREARLAATTLRAMEGTEEDAHIVSPYTASPTEQEERSNTHHRSSPNGSSSSSSNGDNSDAEADESTVTSSTSASPNRRTATSEAENTSSQTGTGSESGAPHDPSTRTVRFDSSTDVAAERDELHKKWNQLLSKGGDRSGNGSIDLSRSIAMAAATAPRRVVMGHTEVLNIGLREAQQHQLKSLQELTSTEYDEEHHHHRLFHFIRMDGGVVTAAIVSSFFSGLLGSYTGVADPPLMIFALAMDISVPELRINYAVSSIVPAALRAVVGIADGFANTSLFVYYLVSVLFAWGGVAFGLHISHHSAVTHITFMVSTVATLVLVAFLMLAPLNDAFVRLAATTACFIVVVAAIIRQQKKPEHHRPPAPPNTPATAAEVEAFEQYWRDHSRRQKALVDYENDGSAVSIISERSDSARLMEDSVRSGTSAAVKGNSASVPPTPGTQPMRRPREGKLSAVMSRGLESEDLPVRSRDDGAEELITIVPVNATSRV